MRCVLMNEKEAKHTFDRNNSLEMNEFLNRIIEQVEQMVSEIDKKDKELAMKEEELANKDKRIEELEAQLEKRNVAIGNVCHYLDMESALRHVVEVAQENSKRIEENANKKAEMIIEEASRNADRIVNESLIKAEKIEQEANLLRRNIRLFKSRAKEIVSLETEFLEDLEKADI